MREVSEQGIAAGDKLLIENFDPVSYRAPTRERQREREGEGGKQDSNREKERNAESGRDTNR